MNPLRDEPSVEFGVRVTPGDSSGYDIEVWHYVRGTKKPADFAKVHAGDLDTALRMAVPYMASAAQPDPFANLMRTGRETVTLPDVDELLKDG